MRQDKYQTQIKLTDIPIEILDELLSKYSDFTTSSDFFTWYENLFGKIALELLIEDLVNKYKNQKNREKLLILIAASLLTSMKLSPNENIEIEKVGIQQLPKRKNDQIETNDIHDAITELFDIESLSAIVEDFTNNLEAGFINISELSILVQKISLRISSLKENTEIDIEISNEENDFEEKIETLELLIESMEFNSKDNIELSAEEIELLSALLENKEITIDELFEVINDIRNRAIDPNAPLITISDVDLAATTNVKSKLFGDESGFLSIDAVSNALSWSGTTTVKGISAIGESLGSLSLAKSQLQDTRPQINPDTSNTQTPIQTYLTPQVTPTTNIATAKTTSNVSVSISAKPTTIDSVVARPISNSPSFQNSTIKFVKAPITIDASYSSPIQSAGSTVQTTVAKTFVESTTSVIPIKVNTDTNDSFQTGTSLSILSEAESKTDRPKVEVNKNNFGDQFQELIIEDEPKLTDEPNGPDTIKIENEAGCAKCISGDCLNCPFGSGGGLDLAPNGGDIPVTIISRTKLTVSAEPSAITISPVTIA